MKTEKNNKVRIVFYLNQDDKKLLKKQCDLLQITPSFFLRNTVLEKLGKSIFQKTPQNLQVKKYQMELVSIGNNLNQIAKKLNSNAKFLIADQQQVLNDIERLNEHIIEIQSKL